MRPRLVSPVPTIPVPISPLPSFEAVSKKPSPGIPNFKAISSGSLITDTGAEGMLISGEASFFWKLVTLMILMGLPLKSQVIF